MDNAYLNEINNYFEKLKSKYSCIKKLYVVGNISIPGISDIDTLMVLDNSSNRCIWSYIDPANGLNKNLLHGPFVTNSANLHDLLSITTLKFNLKVGDGIIDGRELNIHTPDSIMTIIRDSFYLKHFMGKEEPVLNYANEDRRWFLLIINSICYTFRSVINTSDEFKILANGHHLLEKYINKVESIRSNWFNTSEEQKILNIQCIIKLHKKSIIIATETLNRVINKLTDYEGEHSMVHFNNYVAHRLTNLVNESKIETNCILNTDVFEHAVSKFTKVIAAHVILYRERNLAIYDAEFPIPGIGVNLNSSDFNIFVSKIIRKFGLCLKCKPIY